MRNIRLYIGGEQVDLDQTITLPFTFQATDAEMPTAVKNSYSKTITLTGTDRNCRVFGGLWHLDSTVLGSGVGVGIQFNPMKKVGFLLYADEMVIERGYCQLTAISRKGRNISFSLSLFGGLGEFFYNLQTGADGEKKTLADLSWGSDLSFRINASKVQAVWDALLGGTLPTIAFLPMHNGVPDAIDGDKCLINGGGIPASITDGGDTYTKKDGFLLAKFNRKYTEWEVGDLRSYLQRPALRVKDFIDAICDPSNNGGWEVALDPLFFHSGNPYYWKTYITLPLLNVEESTEEVCDDGTFGAYAFHLTNQSAQGDLTPSSDCMTLDGDYVDMSSDASNAYLKISLPVQVRVASGTNYGPIYSNRRFTGKTIAYCTTIQAVAYDEAGTVLGTSPRYVFACKNHHNEVQNLLKPVAAVPASDALIEGVYKYSSGKYLFFQDGTNANTFSLQIDKIARPSSALHKVKVRVYVQRNFNAFTTKPRGNDSSVVGALRGSDIWHDILAGSNNLVHEIQPTQYASDSLVSQDALLSSLEMTPLDLLLSYTKTFGLMWLQDNRHQKVSLLTRQAFYSGVISDIHERIDYKKGLSIRPVAAESNLYTLENEYPETDLAQAYLSDYGRTYGAVRLNTGYDFTLEAKELMEKVGLQGFVDGALSGSGYWEYQNGSGKIVSAIAEGMKVSYYKTSGSETTTKDIEYNLFSVTALQKKDSPVLGVSCKSDDGEESAEETAPALVFVTGKQIVTAAHLSDDLSAMATLNGGPCWLWDTTKAAARVPEFRRVAVFDNIQYSLDFGTPKMTWYAPEQGLAPDQAIYGRFWERYLTDLLSRDTKKVTAYVVFPPHLDMRQEMRKFYLFDRTLWILAKVTDYDPMKEQSTKCEFIRVTDRTAYHTDPEPAPSPGSGHAFNNDFSNSFEI